MEESDNTESLTHIQGTHQLVLSELEEIKDSFKVMKQEMTEFVPVLKDFKGLLQRKPLFERSTFVYLSPLAKEIKAEIMREVGLKIIGPAEEVKALKIEIKKTIAEVEENSSSFGYSIKELFASVKALQKNNEAINAGIELIHQSLGDIKEDLALKASNYEVARITKEIETKATVEDLQSAKDLIANSPTSEQIEKLFIDLQALNQQITSLASQDMVKELETELISDVNNKFEQYANVQMLNEEIDKVISLVKDTNSTLEVFKNRQDNSSVSHKREVEKIHKLLKNRPWLQDIELLTAYIDDKADKRDLDKLKNDLIPQIQFFNEKINLFSRKIEGFDSLLERYDEIILDKAGKVDVFEIKELLPKLMLSVDFEHFKEIDTKQKQVFDEKLSLAHTSVRDVEAQIVKFNTSYKQFKSHFKEFMIKYSSLCDLSYQLDSKADKSDIYAMFDCTSRREEVKLVTQSLEVFHKQLEMAVMLQLIAVKTLLKTPDSNLIKIRQRNEAFNSLNSLLEWISLSIPPEVDKLLDSARMVLGPGLRKSLNEEEYVLPLLGNGKKHRKNAHSLTPMLDSKSFRSLNKD